MREHPLDPSLATDDCFPKATTFMLWISRNAPGWEHSRKNANYMVRMAAGVASSQLRACRLLQPLTLLTLRPLRAYPR